MTTIFGKGMHCCICFETLTPETCWHCPKCGQGWDTCDTTECAQGCGRQ